MQPVQHPCAGRRGGGELRLRHRARDELRLPALPVGRYDGPPGHLVGDGRAVVAAHDVQAQVDPGGDPGRGQHVPVVGVEDVRVDPDGREEPLEVLGGGPVGGGGAPVQVPGRGKYVAARADGDEPGAGPDVGEGRRDLVGQPTLLVHRAQLVRGRHHHRVGVASSSAPCSTWIAKSASVRTGPGASPHVRISYSGRPAGSLARPKIRCGIPSSKGSSPVRARTTTRCAFFSDFMARS